MRKRRPAKVSQIAEPRRTLEIAALLAVLAARQSDTVLKLIEMRISEIWGAAYAASHQEPRHGLPEEMALSLASSMIDPTVSDAVFRAQCQQVLAPWRPEVRRRRRSRAEQVRLHLIGDIRRVRPVLKHLIEIGLQSEGPHEVQRALGELAYCYGQREHSLYWSATSPAGHAWDDLILAPDRDEAFKAYEAATLWEARRGLRNGSLWLPHAEQYGGRHRLLLPPPRWPVAREGFLVRHRLSGNADEFIARTLGQVENGFERLQAAVASGEIEINEGGFVYMRDDPAVRVERGDADLLRTRLYGHLGRVQLTQLLLAIDGETHFTWELLGSAPSVAEELVPLYAAIFVAAMGLDTTDVAMPAEVIDARQTGFAAKKSTRQFFGVAPSFFAAPHTPNNEMLSLVEIRNCRQGAVVRPVLDSIRQP